MLRRYCHDHVKRMIVFKTFLQWVILSKTCTINLKRAVLCLQALALQRIMGDIGMLVGAAATGLVADVSGIDHAFQMNAALLLATSGWFGAKKLHRKKQDVQKAIISLLKSV